MINAALAPLPSAPMADLYIESNAEERKEKRKLLEIAISAGNIEELKGLLKANPKLDLITPDAEGNTPMHWAASKGKIEIIEALLKHNKSLLEIRNKDGQTPLHLAARWGQTATIEFLIKSGGDVKAKSGKGNTPIHLAAWYGHTEAVKVFLNHNPALANIESQTKHIPLHLAAQNGHVEAVRELLKNKADPTAKEQNGYTPVHSAAEYGQTEVITVFLKHDPKLANIKSNNKCAYTPLHWAALKGRTKIVLALLDAGADIKAVANYNNDPSGTAPSLTALHLAAEHGHTDIVNILLERGADARAKDRYGNTPIHQAARFGKTDVIAILLQPDPNNLINVRGALNFTLLHHAADCGQTATVEFLLKRGADLKAINDQGNTAIHQAALRNHVEALKILVKPPAAGFFGLSSSNVHGVNHIVNLKEKKGHTALSLAAQANHEAAVQALLTLGADATIGDATNNTPLHRAVERGNKKAVKILVQHDKRLVHAENECKMTPMHLVALCGGNNDQVSPALLSPALLSDYIYIAETLLSAGADISAKKNYNEQPIHYAARYAPHQMLIFLLQRVPKAIEATGVTDRTPLQYAAKHGRALNACILLFYGANLQAKDRDNKTAYELAVDEQESEVINALDKGYTPLHQAAREGNPQTVLSLLKEGADVTATNKNHNMAIHIAAWAGHIEVVKSLVEFNGRQLEARGGNGYSPLHWAAQQGHIGLMTYLLKCRANIRAKNTSGYAAIHLAVLFGQSGILDILLLIEPSLVNMKGMEGYTPLHCACELKPEIAETSGHLIVEKLLRFKADINMRNMEGQTPLTLAVAKGAPFEVIERLNEAQKLQDKPPTYMEAVQISPANGMNSVLRK